jgi:hypothetical protein
MRKQLAVVGLCWICMMVVPAYAQQFDVAFSGGSLVGSSASTSSLGFVPGEGGGTYVGINGDVIFWKNLGVEGDVFWKANQGLYAGAVPDRPLFWDFNAIYLRHLMPRLAAEAVGGIGGESIRFYSSTENCDFYGDCSNYVSSNHFMADVGGGIRVYVWRKLFVRPELRLYLVHNNLEFSSGFPLRYGASVGYTFGGSQ